MQEAIRAQIDEHVHLALEVRAMADEIAEVASLMAACLRDGGKICWMGNGGSAADCQHLAAEFVGRFRRERGGLPSIAFTTDTSIITAVANDFGFEEIFARQIEALCTPSDLVVGISTSGSSENVLAGIRRATALGACTVGFAGGDGGSLRDAARHCLVVPAGAPARVQEAHIMIGHVLCDLVEAAVLSERAE